MYYLYYTMDSKYYYLQARFWTNWTYITKRYWSKLFHSNFGSGFSRYVYGSMISYFMQIFLISINQLLLSYDLTCSCLSASKIVTGTYILQTNRAVYSKHLISATCNLCRNADETLQHFVLCCRFQHLSNGIQRLLMGSVILIDINKRIYNKF
jgi:hypothetical protein